MAIGLMPFSILSIPLKMLETNEISIRYPDNWTVDQNISKFNIIAFFAPPTKSSNLSPAAIGIYKVQLHKTNLSLININDEMLFHIYSFAQNFYMKNKTFGITSMSKTNLSSSPAIQVDF